jgi:peptidoglycan L-alanyl-D-glutamate endopeptidase CwlK
LNRQLTDLHPKLQPLAEKFQKLCEQAGHPVFLTWTLRTFAEQTTEYAKGRTAPGPIVTYAKAGQSWHNYGLAFDIAFKAPPARGIYDGPWEEVGRIGKRIGLTWGGDFKHPDRPHFEYHPGIGLNDAISRRAHGLPIL